MLTLIALKDDSAVYRRVLTRRECPVPLLREPGMRLWLISREYDLKRLLYLLVAGATVRTSSSASSDEGCAAAVTVLKS
jgi:hypothetical protein